jgi:hypothetical protein
MGATAVPSLCAIALKEWASVLTAMDRGEQLILVRKGGLIEPGSGFELVTPSFVFYPTFEHQTVNYLRPVYQRYVEEALRQRAADGQVRISLYGVAVSSIESNDPAIIERLSTFHVYNQAFLNQRLKWQPDQPLIIVVVRTFRLATPHTLTVVPHYAGCKSWVDLDSLIPLEGSRPVLDEAVFQERVREIAALLVQTP